MPPRKLRRGLHLAGWNALLLIAGLVLIGLAWETWLRSTVPFVSSHWSEIFVPGAGVLLRPHTEVRYTNGLDFWAVSRANRLGFLDHEPPSSERAAESCHITMIGDSFVQARQVPIADKFHVRLEEMAARELPVLDVTTSAFGRRGTGQINQLAYYDEYARRLRPRLVVLVFVSNDYMDNFPLWQSLGRGWDPEHQPYVSAARAEDGSFRLRPPDPDWRRFKLPWPSESPATQQWRTLERQALRASYFLSWLYAKRKWYAKRRMPLSFQERKIPVRADRVRWMELLSRRPAHAPLLDGWRPVSRGARRPASDTVPSFDTLFAEGNSLPLYTEALAFTAFGLDEFKKRAERDGAALVILASHEMNLFGGRGVLASLNEMAAERGIPVVDQGDFIRRQGGELRDAHWAHDRHWNPTGHQWAAEALLEYLKRNQDVCE